MLIGATRLTAGEAQFEVLDESLNPEILLESASLDRGYKAARIRELLRRMSCHDFDDNRVRLHLFTLAYNLGNFLRQLVLPREVRSWTLTTTREKLIKIGAKLVRHARRVTFQLAEVAVPQRLFQAILAAIDRLRVPMPAPG